MKIEKTKNGDLQLIMTSECGDDKKFINQAFKEWKDTPAQKTIFKFKVKEVLGDGEVIKSEEELQKELKNIEVNEA